jgi:hypothetical protein
MRLAASGAPVAMKRRAVEPVNKVKILPVLTNGEKPAAECFMSLFVSWVHTDIQLL